MTQVYIHILLLFFYFSKIYIYNKILLENYGEILIFTVDRSAFSNEFEIDASINYSNQVINEEKDLEPLVNNKDSSDYLKIDHDYASFDTEKEVNKDIESALNLNSEVKSNEPNRRSSDKILAQHMKTVDQSNVSNKKVSESIFSDFHCKIV